MDVDAELDYRPAKGVSLYVSGEYLHARLDDDLPVDGDYLPTKGKHAVSSPTVQLGLGGTYDDGRLFGSFALKYVGRQYATFTNDESIKGYATLDMSVGMHLAGLIDAQRTDLRLNLINATNPHVLSGVEAISTNAQDTVGRNGTTIAGSAPAYYIGSGRPLLATRLARLLTMNDAAPGPTTGPATGAGIGHLVHGMGTGAGDADLAGDHHRRSRGDPRRLCGRGTAGRPALAFAAPLLGGDARADQPRRIPPQAPSPPAADARWAGRGTCLHRASRSCGRAGAGRSSRRATGAIAVVRGDWTYELHRRSPGIDLYRDRVSWTPFLSHPHAHAEAGRRWRGCTVPRAITTPPRGARSR